MFKIITSSKTTECKFRFFKIYINVFTVFNTKFNEDIVPLIIPLCRSRLHRETGQGDGRMGGRAPTCPATSPATLPFLSLCFSHGLPHAVLPTCQGHFHVRSCCFLYPNSFFQIVPCLNPLHSEKGFSKSLFSPNYLKYYSILLLFNPLNLILLQNLLAS